MKPNNIAIIHDFLNQQGGAEYVVAILHEMFPDAPIYTSIYNKDTTWDVFRNARVVTSWMQRIPLIYRIFKKLFFLYPLVFSFFDLSDYEVIISSSSSFAKGVRVQPHQEHICYMHTPPRFLYRVEEYVKQEGIHPVIRMLLPLLLTYLQIWDRYVMSNVNHIIANSINIKDRIHNIYGRYAVVVYPPVDTSRFKLSENQGDYFLIVSRLVGYKRIDLAVEACNITGQKLVVIGKGPDINRLQKIAKPNIIFMGRQADVVVEALVANCKALIFPGEEDFGITPVEAQSAGKPVIAFQGGGALETVVHGQTGLLFREQTAESLSGALREFDEFHWDKQAIRDNALKFSKERFRQDMEHIINNLIDIKDQPHYQQYKYYYRDQRIQTKQQGFFEIYKTYRKLLK